MQLVSSRSVAPGEKFVNYSISRYEMYMCNPKSSAFNKSETDTDEHFNLTHGLKIGRLSIEVDMLVNMVQLNRLHERTQAITFEAYILDNVCYTHLDKLSFIMVKTGNLK